MVFSLNSALISISPPTLAGPFTHRQSDFVVKPRALLGQKDSTWK
jgi:hypothetical protein